MHGKDVEMNIEGVALVDSNKTENEDEDMIETEDEEGSVAIGFFDAWRLPNVAYFAFCLFVSKLVAYTFLYWLPFYIRNTAIAGVHLSHKTAGILSTIFDIGGVFCGISAGFISDMIEAIFIAIHAYPDFLPSIWKYINVHKHWIDVCIWLAREWTLLTNNNSSRC